MKGINFSGARLGAAATMPVLPWMIQQLGWQQSFVVLMFVGFAWSAWWWIWFRDEPADDPGLRPEELAHILATRQQPSSGEHRGLRVGTLLGSGNLWLIMGQYFASNFTFFFCLTWLYPYIKKTYQLESVEAGVYSMMPFLAGAAGNIAAGSLVDVLYRRGWPVASRRLPAVVGFLLAALGLVMSVEQVEAVPAVAWLSLAIFGADATIAPSWAFCIDIGGRNAGTVSGTMNMAGNLGSACVGLVFADLVQQFGPKGFFYTGAVLNLMAIALWLAAHPGRKLETSA